MWIDQRDRDSKSGWVWESILFHAAIIAYFVMTPMQNLSEPSAAPNKGSEAVTMTMQESAGSEAVAQAEESVEKPVVVAKPTPKKTAKAKKAKKIVPVVMTSLPKKEVVEETPEEKLPEQAVVIPETSEEMTPEKEEQQLAENDSQVQPIPLENLKEQSLDDAVAGQAEGQDGSQGAAQGAPSTGSGQGSSINNPRSYLDLKQKSGNVPPQYPESARLQGEQGRAGLRYFVDESGKVSNIQVVQSSGSEALDREAVNAISKYQYEPGQSGWTAHPVNFTLKGPQQQTPGRLRTAKHP